MTLEWLSSLGWGITRLEDSVSLARRLDLVSGLGPTAELLFFVWPKKSNPKKGHPNAAYSLRSSLLNGVA